MHHLDHAIPVATVTRAGDKMALTDAQSADGFMLGGASLNLTDPDHPEVTFSITNSTQMPIQLSTVHLQEVKVYSRADGGPLIENCVTAPWLAHPGAGDRALQPGAAVAVEMPIPQCGALGQGDLLAFLVFVQSDGGPTQWFASRSADDQPNSIMRRAFETLRSQAQR
jgi:hypothetical protein